MNIVATVVGVGMIVLGLGTLLVAKRGEYIPKPELLLAGYLGILGAFFVAIHALPAGPLQWTLSGTLLLLLVCVAVARRRAVRKERSDPVEGAA